MTNDKTQMWLTPHGYHSVAIARVDAPRQGNFVPVVFQGTYPSVGTLALNVRAYPTDSYSMSSFFGAVPSLDTTIRVVPIEGNLFRADLLVPTPRQTAVLVIQPIEVEATWTRPANASALKLQPPTPMHDLGANLQLEREVGGRMITVEFGAPSVEAAYDRAVRFIEQNYTGDAADITTWTQVATVVQVAAEQGYLPNPGVDLTLYASSAKRGQVVGTTLTIVQKAEGENFHVTTVTGALTHTKAGVLLSTQTTTKPDHPPTQRLKEIYAAGSTRQIAKQWGVIAEMGADGKDVIHGVASTASTQGWKDAREVAAKSIATKGLRHAARLIPVGVLLTTAIEAAEHWAEAQAAVSAEARQAALDAMEQAIAEGLVSSTTLGEVLLLAWDLSDPLRRHFFTPGEYALTDDLGAWWKFMVDERIPESYAKYAHNVARSRMEAKYPGIPLASWTPPAQAEVDDSDSEGAYHPVPQAAWLGVLGIGLAAFVFRRRA